MSKLVESRFLTKPYERLDQVDIYEVKDNAVRGSGSRSGDGLETSVLQMMRSPETFVENSVNRAIERGMDGEQAASQANAVLAETRKRVESTLGSAFGHLKDLSGDLKKAVSDNIGNLVVPTTQYLANIDGEIKSLDDVLPDKMSMVSSAVSHLLPKGTNQEAFMQFLDVGAEEAVYSTLLPDVIKSGAIDAVGPLLDNLAIPESAKRVALNVINDVIDTGDIDALGVLTNYVNENEILSQYPDLTSSILETFRQKGGEDEHQQFTNLTTTVTAVQPGWYTVQRGKETITRLEPFRNASDDAREMFLRNFGEGDYLVETLLANEYQPKDLDKLAREQYPLAVF